MIVQGDVLNGSRVASVVVVPLTSDLRWAAAPGNVMLAADRTGLPRNSVANASLIAAADRSVLSERVGRLSRSDLLAVLDGIDVVLGRDEA